VPPGQNSIEKKRYPRVLADLVDLHDVRVVQPGDRLGLDPEPRPRLVRGRARRLDHLQGHEAVQVQLKRLVDDAHAASAQLRQDRVAGHPLR
jgi:hypothetical protein